MPDNKSLDQFIAEQDEGIVRELAAAALKIGYTFGGRFDPPMVTASMAQGQLREIEDIVYEVTGDMGLFTQNEEAEYVNEWRRVMGDKLLDRNGYETHGDEICTECGGGFHDTEHDSDGMCAECIEDRADNDDENEEN